MDTCVLDCGTLPASAHVAHFRGASGVDEYHLTVQPTEYGDAATQLGWLLEAYRRALEAFQVDLQTAVFRRFFCSDPVNQAATLRDCPWSNPESVHEACAVSWAGQPPRPPAKLALWAYHVADPAGLEKTREGPTLTLRRGQLTHYWTTGIASSRQASAFAETRDVFSRYERELSARNLSLSEHVVRTWLFVADIDANYHGMVAARREFFAQRGLRPDTHFIASSGIGAMPERPGRIIALDAYAVGGLRREQVAYLSAPDHLGPTHLYGVTFERGTSVSYQDRRHVVISGTASIDRDGRVVHAGDLGRQLERTLENVAALLARAGATLDDLVVSIAYVRDPADQERAQELLRERLPRAPLVVGLAPVCRPAWLIEVEGLAVVPAENPLLPPL